MKKTRSKKSRDTVPLKGCSRRKQTVTLKYILDFLTKVQGIYGQVENTAEKESSIVIIFIFASMWGLKLKAKYLYNCRKLSNMELKRKTVSAVHQG